MNNKGDRIRKRCFACALKCFLGQCYMIFLSLLMIQVMTSTASHASGNLMNCKQKRLERIIGSICFQAPTVLCSSTVR